MCLCHRSMVSGQQNCRYQQVEVFFKLPESFFPIFANRRRNIFHLLLEKEIYKKKKKKCWCIFDHFVCLPRFLLQCLEDLDKSLRKLNSRLFVIRGQPADVLPKLFKEWGTTNLTFEEDPEPFGRARDFNISTLCTELGISVVQKVSHTLYKLDE